MFLTNPRFPESLLGNFSKNIFLSSLGTNFYKSRSASCTQIADYTKILPRNDKKIVTDKSKRRLNIQSNKFISPIRSNEGKKSFSQITHNFFDKDSKG